MAGQTDGIGTTDDMAKIAFLLLCHKDPAEVTVQVAALTAAGDAVAVHYDAAAPGFETLEAGLAGNARAVLVRPRRRCGWGQWSIVQATIDAARTALDTFPDATHLYLISGDCRPIRSAVAARAMLDANGRDRIECADFLTSGWIRTGMREDRLIYRHLFNERRHRRLFYASLAVQRALGLARALPSGLDMRIGSQWWCLRRATVERVLTFEAKRRHVARFFRTTWIPDETFFQTLVPHLVPKAEIDGRPPTFLAFTDYGIPTAFHDDHRDMLLRQDALFARKISPGARRLREGLDTLWVSTRRDFPVSGDGHRQFDVVTAAGRAGLRTPERFWEREATLGHDRRVSIVVSARRDLAHRLVRAAGVPAFGYLFSEEEAGLPAMGGLERGLGKRRAHRRAFLNALFRQSGGDAIAFCADPSERDVLIDLASDRSELRVLLIDEAPVTSGLRAKAEEAGLAGPATAPDALARLLPILAREHAARIAAIRDADLPDLHRIAPGDDPAAIADALRAALDHDATVSETFAKNLFDRKERP